MREIIETPSLYSRARKSGIALVILRTERAYNDIREKTSPKQNTKQSAVHSNIRAHNTQQMHVDRRVPIPSYDKTRMPSEVQTNIHTRTETATFIATRD